MRLLLRSRKGLAFVLTSGALVLVALGSGVLGVKPEVYSTLAVALVASQTAYSGSNVLSKAKAKDAEP